MKNREFILGNHIVAASAINLGFQCAASYPGTPSAEIMSGIQEIGKKTPKMRMEHAEWSINEKLSLEVAAGAAMSGIRSLCSMKSVGLNVAADPLMTLSYIDLKAALLIIVADTPGCLSSQNEQDCRWYGMAAKLPVLEPISPKDIERTMERATEISEKLKMPVIVRLTTRISHGRQSTDIKLNRPPLKRAKFEKDVKRFVMLPVHGLSAHKKLFEKYDKTAKLLRPEISGKGKISVVASGQAYANAKDIIDEERIDCKLIRIVGIPFDEKYLKEQIADSDEVVVLEEGHRIIEEKIRSIRKDIVSKNDSHGELGNIGVRRVLSEVFPIKIKKKEPLKLPPRPPRLCAACPHMMTFYWMRQFDVPFPGDIGCYSLGYQFDVLDSLVCMGASIGIGQALPGKKIAAIGDSTFYHAGIPALINAVEQKRDICVIILDNEYTAMTGHQPVPKTNMEELCKACGAEVHVIDPFSRKMKKIIQDALDSKGVHVVIARRTCTRKTNAKQKFFISDRCTNCGKCDEIFCPAIVNKGESHEINDLCWGCGFCATICPEVAIKREKK